MGNLSIKPSKYVQELAEVYLSYITSHGIKVIEEKVFLDIAVEVVNPRLHLYDVINKWVLALPGAYHELSDIMPGELTNWEKFVEDELTGTNLLKEFKLLNRCSTRCTVKLKNKFGTSKFNSYLTRNVYSLAEERVYALGADSLDPIVYSGMIPTKIESLNDYSNPKSYLLLIQPLLFDVKILAEKGYIADSKNYALVKYNNRGNETVVLRLLCSGNNIRKISVSDYDHHHRNDDFYILALQPLEEFLLNFLTTDSYISDFEEIIKDIIVYYANYMKTIGYNESVGRIAIINKRHISIDCKLTGEEIKISTNPEERTIQLLEATEKLAQSKKHIGGLFYQGVNMFYMDGQILVNSVKNGGDYMLRLMSLIPGRLTTFLSYSTPATKLLLASVYTKNSNPIAFEYILVHDNRKGRENSISYKELVQRINYNNEFEDVFKNAYINRIGPMYELLLD